MSTFLSREEALLIPSEEAVASEEPRLVDHMAGPLAVPAALTVYLVVEKAVLGTQ